MNFEETPIQSPAAQAGPAAPQLAQASTVVAGHAQQRWKRPGLRALASAPVIAGLELLALLLWSLVVAAPLMNFDPNAVPTGREFLSAVQSHLVWNNLQECGWCALWNGGMRGGAPALADPYGSMWHPLVIVATLGWGVINGSKLLLLGSFFLAGLAQWWLAHEFGLSRMARLWTAALAITAGHVLGRAENGNVGLVLSTASCALVFPALLRLFRRPRQRNAVIVAVTLALALVSGQGYQQIGLAFCLPLFLLLLPWSEREQRELLIRQALLAAGLALLLASPFLVPFLHFYPQFAKDFDFEFRDAQPFRFLLLNLVIDNPEYYRTEVLGKRPYPFLYLNYIGWIPLLLALLGLAAARDRLQRRRIVLLGSLAFLTLWIASAEPLRLLIQLSPSRGVDEFLAGIRNCMVIAGLAVPPLLALAGLGLDLLLKLAWPRLQLLLSSVGDSPRSLAFSTHWFLVIPLLLSLNSVFSFGRNWIGTTTLSPDVPRVIEALRTPDLQWVNATFGDHTYVSTGIAAGLKLNFGFRAWNWRDRPVPEALLQIGREGDQPPLQTTLVGEAVPGLLLYQALPGQEYAQAQLVDGSVVVCQAQGAHGMLAIRCDLPRPGVLTVRENHFAGWNARVNGQSTPLFPGSWLNLAVPAGASTIELRYQPWDVPLGLFFGLCGMLLSAVLWWRGRKIAV